MPRSPQRAERTADETLQTLRTTSRTAAAVAELADAGALSGPDSGLGLVSVIMPVRNCADVVGDAIDSVRFQRYRDWELIIIDDGSSDGTLEILDSAAEADPRIVVRRTGGGVRRGAGASAARNLGLAESAGVVVAYLDSDNRFTSGYLRPDRRGVRHRRGTPGHRGATARRRRPHANVVAARRRPSRQRPRPPEHGRPERVRHTARACSIASGPSTSRCAGWATGT
ncbi:MAG: glycosyltransferase family A protein [Acidimicrobiales bacterium]